MHAFLRSVLAFACLAVGAQSGSAGEPVRVAATTTIVADLVRQVGGNRVAVDALMGAGVDPHLYKASAGDVARLGRAEVVFYSGLFLEGRMEDVFRRLAERKRRVFAVADAVPADRLVRPPAFEGHPDPHVWGDPGLWKHAVDAVARGLSETDPSGAEEYRSRAKAYQGTLETLGQWAKARVELIPRMQRVVITSHDAFSYFGRAFGLEVVGVQGISTVTEAGLADLTKVADLVRERGLKAIFVESSVPPAAIERISRDSGARVGGELFSDALGTPGEIREGGGERYDVGTYVGMLKHNVNTIVEALK
jgi:manganese/zinc/iron transport system substrate-binding protein